MQQFEQVSATTVAGQGHAESERVFSSGRKHVSTMGLLLNGKRFALAPHRANWLSFIHYNFALYFKTQNDSDV